MLAVTDTGTAFSVNVAVTVESTVSGIEHVLVPEQFVAFPVPLFQPAKVDPFAAFAVRITVPWTSWAEQVAPQSSPGGLDVTEPVPIPAFVTVKFALTGAPVNVAVTDVLALSVTTHASVPVQPPLQPVNPAPVAVNVTEAPLRKSAEHVAPQLRPVGFDVTLPLPASVTDNVEKFACKCVVAVASLTSVSPGKEVSKAEAEKSILAGNPPGGVGGT
jgi:hypothetical protein